MSRENNLFDEFLNLVLLDLGLRVGVRKVSATINERGRVSDDE